jgi:hypothetical protein
MLKIVNFLVYVLDIYDVSAVYSNPAFEQLADTGVKYVYRRLFLRSISAVVTNVKSKRQ